jgi:succinoglycan biosynthesis transport protein ExoP
LKRWLEGNFSQAAAFVARHIRHHNLRHFIFTGASSAEGTTTTMLGVARELQSTYGLRVLACEVNARSGGFKRNLKLADAPFQFIGEMSVSSDNILFYDAGMGLLSIRGKEVERNALSFSANLLKQALQELANDFDVILIDAPPVLEYTEVLAAAPEVDGVVLVIRAGHTRREMLTQTRRVFEVEQVNLLGSVLAQQKHVIPGWFYRLMFK